MNPQANQFNKVIKDCVDRNLDVGSICKHLWEATNLIMNEVSKLEMDIPKLKFDEITLDEKIEKRRTELERNQTRLATLQVYFFSLVM